MKFFKTFLSFILLSFSFSSYSGKCKQVFEQLELDLFTPSLLRHTEYPFFFKKTISDTPHKSHTLNEPANVTYKTAPITASKKEEILKSFLHLFHTRNIKQIEKLVLEYPFLKKSARFPTLNSSIHIEHQSWMPLGWTPPQMASYLKDLDLLNLFLKLDFNIRTQKKQGGVSLENNPLHIAIKRNFFEGAQSILNHVGHIKFGVKNRLIDEKTHDKYTPWALAIQHYQKSNALDFIDLIGRYTPSGYVESYNWNGPKDGYKLADETGSQAVIHRANRYLMAPNYEYYQEIKQKSPYPFRKRTKYPHY
ncbi:MAG: hypothetical protein OXN83_00520 [Oligoflexia bacterium]|nr:hypothetical protein [Oligoflexia bacterium]